MHKRSRSGEFLNEKINAYLKKNGIQFEEASWEIRKSPLGGFGVFAKRNINVGEVIFLDYPVILGPRCAKTSPRICVNCFSKENLKGCKNNCGLPLCSYVCQDSHQHKRECKLLRQMKREETDSDSIKLLKCLSPVRALLLSEEDKEVVRLLKAHKGRHHGYEVDVLINELKFEVKEDDREFMRFVCSVLDANAFEVIIGNEDSQSSLRGLYPLGGLANHRCFPNTMHVFDDKRRMVVRASVFIQKDTEIFHSYSRIVWATMTRAYHLMKTKHFLCMCERCRDPTEFRTYMSAIFCNDCKGKVISVDPLKRESIWECEDCKKSVTGAKVGELMTILGSVLKVCDSSDIQRVLKFLDNKLVGLVPENNQVIVEIKCKIIWMLGHEEGFTWKELPLELLDVKKKFCHDILTLLEELRIGQCKMRGLVLFELYQCTEEIKTRINKQNKVDVIEDESQRYLDEVMNILMYDVSAPDLIKQKWQLLGKT